MNCSVHKNKVQMHGVAWTCYHRQSWMKNLLSMQICIYLFRWSKSLKILKQLPVTQIFFSIQTYFKFNWLQIIAELWAEDNVTFSHSRKKPFLHVHTLLWVVLDWIVIHIKKCIMFPRLYIYAASQWKREPNENGRRTLLYRYYKA